MTDARDAEPRVKVRGGDDPSVTVVGGIHGDEPAGEHAVKTLLEGDYDLRRPVKFIVANPPALDACERYLDVDMNRVFPGDSDSPDLERRLAARVCAETSGYETLALHSTRSRPEPFALVAGRHEPSVRLASRLPVEHVVDESALSEGSFTQCGTVVSVECGCQRTEAAAETAVSVTEAFLRTTGALDGETDADYSPDYYEITEAIPKRPGADYTVRVDNFDLVGEGDVYATGPDGDISADEPFYPVLMSEDGYEDILGYRARRVGATAAEAVEHFDGKE